MGDVLLLGEKKKGRLVGSVLRQAGGEVAELGGGDKPRDRGGVLG